MDNIVRKNNYIRHESVLLSEDGNIIEKSFILLILHILASYLYLFSKMTEEEIKKEIMKTVELYIEGGRNPAGGQGKKAFAQWATMSWNENGKLATVPIQTLYSVLDATGPQEVIYTLKKIAISPTAATVWIESSFSKFGKFNDMFSLVKDESGWKIVSKVYNVIKGYF